MFFRICFYITCGLYPRVWDPDLTFCTFPEESLSAGFVPLTQTKGFSGDSNNSLRYAWSFSLCPEMGIGQENSTLCLFSDTQTRDLP